MNAVVKTDLPVGERLKINEIFFSLQGESSLVGKPTVFVRLTGCPLRCQYCDTAYAFHEGGWMSFDEILSQVEQHQTRFVCVTGGEPLAQKNSLGLMTRLCDHGYTVSIETSGSYDISSIDERVIRVMDLKTPGSAECDKNRLQNLQLLTAKDQLKFVVCDRADYEWAKQILSEHKVNQDCEILMSPSFAQVAPKTLAEWILADRLPVRMQVQLHKLLWGDTPGH